MIKNKFVIAKFIQLDELIEQLTHKIVRYDIKLKMRLSLRMFRYQAELSWARPQAIRGKVK
jgi:hypothetical protein